MLRSRNLFNVQKLYHHWCYATRSSLLWSVHRFPKNHGLYALRPSSHVSTILDATAVNFQTFYHHCWNFVPSCMLRHALSFFWNHWCYALIFWVFEHHWCGALRFSVQLSNIMDYTLRSSLVLRLWSSRSLQPPNIFHHWCCAIRSSLQFANMIDHTLQDHLLLF